MLSERLHVRIPRLRAVGDLLKLRQPKGHRAGSTSGLPPESSSEPTVYGLLPPTEEKVAFIEHLLCSKHDVGLHN